jgi:hypothetical protein
MARSAGTFKQGQSGNNKGRPPKERALTAILERAGAKSVEVDGKAISGKQLVARMVWEGVATRSITFPDGDTMKLQPYHWLELVKWMYGHVDGPPKAEISVDTNGKMIIEVVYVEVDADTSAPTFGAENGH